MFKDRKDAGKRLAKALEKYKSENPIVLAIPRGGVEVGFEVAKHLKCDFSILVSRKLRMPHNPEAGFGALAEDGSKFMFQNAREYLSDAEIEREIDFQKQEVKRRVRDLRKNEPLPDLEDRTVILVDDGIAMGSTMRASIPCAKNEGASEIIVGSPVASPHTMKDIEPIVDDLIVIESPPNFRAVAQVYENWYDVPDHEVVEILEKWDEISKSNNQ